MSPKSRALCVMALVLFLQSDAARAEVLPPFQVAHPELAQAYKDLAEGKDRKVIVNNLKTALNYVKDENRRSALAEAMESIDLALKNEALLSQLGPKSLELQIAKLIDASGGDVWLHRPDRYCRSWKVNGKENDFLIQRVLDAGDAAIPDLIDRLADRASTRIVMSDKLGGWPRILPMNYAALCLIEKFTGCYFDIGVNGEGREHVARWWKETGKASRTDRMKWQFPHAGSIGMGFMFDELRKAKEDEYLKVVLRKRASWMKEPRAAELLVQLGEKVPFDDCEARLKDPKWVVNSHAVIYMVNYGDKPQFRALAQVVERAIDGDAYARSYVGQILFSLSESKQKDAYIALEPFLEWKESYDRRYSGVHLPPTSEQLRNCDVAMYLLAKRGNVKDFQLTWPEQQRDRVINAYRKERSPERH